MFMKNMLVNYNLYLESFYVFSFSWLLCYIHEFRSYISFPFTMYCTLKLIRFLLRLWILQHLRIEFRTDEEGKTEEFETRKYAKIN